VNFVADRAAELITAGRGQQHSGADSYAYSSGKRDEVAEGVIVFRIKIVRPVAKVRDPVGDTVGGAFDAVGNPVADFAGYAIGLVEKVHCGFENRPNQIVHMSTLL
jgi:hypothetical protein